MVHPPIKQHRMEKPAPTIQTFEMKEEGAWGGGTAHWHLPGLGKMEEVEEESVGKGFLPPSSSKAGRERDQKPRKVPHVNLSLF